MSNGCVTRLRAVEQPAMRLFLFHCAGGSHLMFRGWDSDFPVDWELCPVEAPGRGRLADHPPFTDAASLAKFLLLEITPELNRPFALFGHSMGGLVAYDLALRLASAGLPQPSWIGVSARHAPDQMPLGTHFLHHTLSDIELRRVVRDMGGTPPAVLTDAKLWAIIAPVLRADLRLADTWRHPDGPRRVAAPVSAFGGIEDPVTPVERLEAWRQHSARFLGSHHFAGGHFYLQDHLPELACKIIADVTIATGLAYVARFEA